MPDRLLRDELLTSDRWLGLGGKDTALGNARRLAFVACISTADTLGNMEATGPRLARLWRDFGLDDDAAIDATLADFKRTDIARTYEADNGKRFLHLPRYRQQLRYLGRLCPLSPSTTDEEKQSIRKNSRSEHVEQTQRAPSEHPARTTAAPVDVGLKRVDIMRSDVDVGLKRGDDDYAAATRFSALAKSLGLKPEKDPIEKEVKPESQNPKPEKVKPNGTAKGWWSSDQGIERKASELRLEPAPGETYGTLRQRCFDAMNAKPKP